MTMGRIAVSIGAKVSQRAALGAIVVALGVTLATLSSCSITRRIPEGNYMLKRNVVAVDRTAPRRERIYARDLEKYIQQRPNRRFLGINLGAWLHAQANPDKDNAWNRFLRRQSDEPVVWNPALTERSAEYLRTYVASRGFFGGDAWYTVDTLGGRRVRVRYGVRQGAPWRIGSVRTTFHEPALREIAMADSARTLLHRGGMFDAEVMDAERERITAILRDRGYWDFDKSSITFLADSTAGARTVDFEMVVEGRPLARNEIAAPLTDDARQPNDRQTDATEQRYTPHKLYRMGRIVVRPGYDPLGERDGVLDTTYYNGLDVIHAGGMRVRVWPRLLRRAIKLHSGELYSASAAAETSAELMRLGAFRSVSVLFDRATQTDTTRTATLPSEGILDCEIRGVAGLRQTLGMEIEGSGTTSFWGFRATVGYQNRNLFRGAELFDLSFTSGFEFLRAGTRKLSYELGGRVSLSFPRFVFWGVERNQSIRRPMSTLALSANWQDRAYYSRALFGLNWGYTWGVKRFTNFTLKPIDISVVDMRSMDPEFREQLGNPYLVASYDDQLIAGLSASWVYNNQARNLRAGAIVVRVNAETTGNLVAGVSRLAKANRAEGYYNLFGLRFAQYARADLSFSHNVVLGEKTAFAYRLYAGAIYSYGNSASPPFDKQFFAGGANSMRGWAVRTLGPGAQQYVWQPYPAQMGDVKFEANAELRFPMFRSVGGAVFLDAGNVWLMRSRPDTDPDPAVFRIGTFYRQLGFNTGLGVRVDLRFVVLRLDWGIQLHSPNRPVAQRWIHDFRWRNTALNFGVGYPF